MKKTEIVLTGGHAGTTALAVVKEIKRRKPSWKIFWIGAAFAIEGKNIPTLESRVFPKMGVIFKPIFTGRLQRKFTFWTIPSLLKIPFGFIHALALLVAIKPKVILSFGGFAAFPVVVVGALLGIPVIIHEQTVVVGRANKFSAPFAKKIALAREESLKFFPKDKCVVVGNPILPEMEKILPKREISTPPEILVTGGSRGSTTINSLVGEILEELLSKYKLIHHTGEIDFFKFKKRKSGLAGGVKERYEVYSHIPASLMPGILEKVDILVARAGANTVSEAVAAKKPSILIPLPFSYMDEQTGNADFAEKFGVAKVIPQEGITGQRLLKEINEMQVGWLRLSAKVKGKVSPDIGAALRLVSLIEEYI
ncbi:UDP-N-acetylglucosamine--N-acetylmuramyl-(pentapeptide) pyrophosphoryl-undecaprenol N-acetylglucosamine transferase [Candidatus Woesebacteria bacterium]|nr:UDP-N-acetylglucosamine--N-acetylmuramyl-(pentapeptide) pyrophosphoryl-undecaprenol N-acetylglucosamine transferase [Candidatus Woesebacteria bacterium]